MKYETKDKQVVVKITPSQLKKLERMAAKNGMNKSQYMRYLLNTQVK